MTTFLSSRTVGPGSMGVVISEVGWLLRGMFTLWGHCSEMIGGRVIDYWLLCPLLLCAHHPIVLGPQCNGQASTKLKKIFSRSFTGCSSSNQEAVINAEIIGMKFNQWESGWRGRRDKGELLPSNGVFTSDWKALPSKTLAMLSRGITVFETNRKIFYGSRWRPWQWSRWTWNTGSWWPRSSWAASSSSSSFARLENEWCATTKAGWSNSRRTRRRATDLTTKRSKSRKCDVAVWRLHFFQGLDCVESFFWNVTGWRSDLVFFYSPSSSSRFQERDERHSRRHTVTPTWKDYFLPVSLICFYIWASFINVLFDGVLSPFTTN